MDARSTASPGGFDLSVELQLIKKLHRLAMVSWSPTLRANREAFELRVSELQEDTGVMKKRGAKAGK